MSLAIEWMSPTHTQPYRCTYHSAVQPAVDGRYTLANTLPPGLAVDLTCCSFGHIIPQPARGNLLGSNSRSTTPRRHLTTGTIRLEFRAGDQAERGRRMIIFSQHLYSKNSNLDQASVGSYTNQTLWQACIPCIARPVTGRYGPTRLFQPRYSPHDPPHVFPMGQGSEIT